MNIDDIVIPTVEVPLSGFPEGTTVAIRGLSFSDLEPLYRAFQKEAESLFSRFREEGADTEQEIVKALLTEFPTLASCIIAAANGRPDAAEKFAKFPIVAQTDLLLEVIRMTVHSAEAVKKILETVAAGLETINQAPRKSSSSAP